MRPLRRRQLKATRADPARAPKVTETVERQPCTTVLAVVGNLVPGVNRRARRYGAWSGGYDPVCLAGVPRSQLIYKTWSS